MIGVEFNERLAKQVVSGEKFGFIKTKNGLNVNIIHFHAKGELPVVGLVDFGERETARQWTANGKRSADGNFESVLDLVIEIDGGEQ